MLRQTQPSRVGTSRRLPRPALAAPRCSTRPCVRDQRCQAAAPRADVVALGEMLFGRSWYVTRQAATCHHQCGSVAATS
jgi:hypothetical protein